MTRLRSAGQAPVYQVSVKDTEGFPTVVVAGPTRDQTWLYVHDSTPTVLRLHQLVVRFLVDALRDVAIWFDQPEHERGALMWTLPKQATYSHPECVLVASHSRAWLHVFAASPSVVRLNPRTVQFLQYALAELPVTAATEARRWTGQASDSDQAWIGHLELVR